LADEDVETITVTGDRDTPRSAGYQPYDLGQIAAALAAYSQQYFDPGPQFAPVDSGGGQPEPQETITVTAPAPVPVPAPRPPPLPTGGDLLRDLLNRPLTAPGAPAPPSEFERLIQGRDFTPHGPPPKTITVTGTRTAATVLGRAALRTLGPLSILGFLPTMLNIGESLDDRATRSWLDRLYGPARGSRQPANRPGRTVAPVPTGGRRPPVGRPPDDLIEIVIEGRTPRPVAPRPPTLVIPGIQTGVFPEVRLSPSPSPSPSPDLVGWNPDAFQVPTVAAPAPLPVPAPRPQPNPQPDPDFAQPPQLASPPVAPRAPTAPLPWPGGLGMPSGGDCDCKQTKKPKKQKKPRTVCWKGSYIEKSTGLSKTRRVRVSCVTGEELNQ